MKPVFACLCTIFLHTNVSAQSWDILLDHGREMTGATVTDVTSDSLLFRLDDGTARGIPLSEVKVVSYRTGLSKAGQGALIGFLSGTAIGYVAGAIAEGGNESSTPNNNNKTNLKVVLPIAGGLVGGLIGLGVGADAGKRSVDVSSLDDQEKCATLSALLGHGVSPRGTFAPGANGPSPQGDVLYLKNGSIIHGTVSEWIPDSTVKIVTADSSVFVFRSSEVARLTKELPAAPSVAPGPAPKGSNVREAGSQTPPAEVGPVRFELRFGAGLPTGDFAGTTSQSDGFAKTGVMFGGGVEYRFTREGSLVANISLAFNGVDVNTSGSTSDIDSWLTVWPMVGFRLYPPMNSVAELYVQGAMGILFGTYPGMKVSSGNNSFTEASAGGSSVAFSLGTGFVIVRRLSIGVSYLYGSPDYDLTGILVQNGITTVQKGKLTQKTGVVQLSAGVVF